jgi:hypothetical protein
MGSGEYSWENEDWNKKSEEDEEDEEKEKN